MRMIAIATAGVAFVLAGAANAQAPSKGPAQQPPATSQQEPSAAPAIKSVSVIELNELPAEAKSQADKVVASQSAEELKEIQNAIEESPSLKKALEAKGFSSRDVIIAQLNDEGELLVITKRAG